MALSESYSLTTEEVNRVSEGRWDYILRSLGGGKFNDAIDKAYSPSPHVKDPTGLHSPSSKNGKNFRFFPGFEMCGASITNPKISRSGYDLLMDVNDWNFPQVLEEVYCLMTGSKPSSKYGDDKKVIHISPLTNQQLQERQAIRAQEDEYRKKRAAKNLNDCYSQREVDAEYVLQYLHSRGLPIKTLPDCLFGHPDLFYQYEMEIQDNKPEKFKGSTRAMLADIVDLSGKPLSLHRTYLDNKTSEKFVFPDDSSAKKLMESPSSITGGSVPLYDPSQKKEDKILSLSEGIETAIAVHLATGLPSWSTLTAGNLEVVQVPGFIEHVIIWADRDISGTGQTSAIILAERLTAQGKKATIRLPRRRPKLGEKSVDWLDVFVESGPDEFLLAP